MRVVSVAYLVLAAELPNPAAGTDAADARWRPVDALRLEPLRPGLRPRPDPRRRPRAGPRKLEYSPLATAFCDEEFTVAELRRVYEVVWGVRLDPRNFHRKVTGARDFPCRRAGGRRERRPPAQLYRRGKATLLNPPITR